MNPSSFISKPLLRFGQPWLAAALGLTLAIGAGLLLAQLLMSPPAGDMRSLAAYLTLSGAATMGGVAGVGTVALIDSALQPCRGFHALFGANKDACVNGEYVGYQPEPRRGRYVR